MDHFFIDILLYLFVFATGAAGLIYEVTWQRYLSRLLGSDHIATAIILATFLGGISLGYYLCGKFTTRVKNHFKVYALLEGIIAIWALFFPNIFTFVDSFTRFWSFSPPLIIIMQGLLCSAFLMGPPTICMGGTIPFLTRAVSKNIEESTSILAKIYSVNSGGAFLGTLFAGFYLIPRYGLPLTIMGTAFLNGGAAIFYYLLSTIKQQPQPSQPAKKIIEKTERANVSISPRLPSYSLYIIVFLSGFYLMSLENVLIRITNLSLGGTSYSFSMIVSVFILSIAIGSYVVGKIGDLPKYSLFLNQLFITLSLMVLYLTLDKWPYWAHIIRIAFQSNMVGFWAYYTNIFLALSLILVLPIALMGATTPIAFHELRRDLKNVGSHSGILFSLNTMGNLLGSLVGGIVLYYMLNNAGVFLISVLFAALSTCIAAWYLSKRYFLFASILAVMVFTSIFYTPSYNEKNFMIGTFRWRSQLSYSLSGPRTFYKNLADQRCLKFYKDGPCSSVAITETPYNHLGQKSISIMINGKIDSSTAIDSCTLKLLAHLPALLAEKKKNVMVIGLGTGVTAGELSLYPDVQQIDVAEICPTVVEALPYFGEANYNVHKNPKVTIHIGDAFRILRRSQKKWDIITSEPSNPWVTGVDLLFTQEFYKLVKEHLTEEGTLLQWAHFYSASPSILGMIVNTVQQEFKQSRVFMGNPGDLLILASKKPLSIKNLKRAEEIFNRISQVKNSLEMINITSLDSILIREIWPPSYIAEYFTSFGIQTMDNPRLHYMAGKSFFTEDTVSINFLFGPGPVPYLREFLMVKKHDNWPESFFSKEFFDSLVRSTNNIPTASVLKLKAYLSNPSLFPLSEKEKEKFEIDLIPFITNSGQDKASWARIGLKDASIRKKAEPLISHINKFRNWVVPYSTDGLKALLKEGMTNGEDAYETNWCALQLIRLLRYEKADLNSIKEILDQMIMGNDGKILLRKKDKALLKLIKAQMDPPSNKLMDIKQSLCTIYRNNQV